ncbi:MAG: S41 family peptidase [Burkholderiales bacterium]|nr:S41 family peptidase [Burkholderiales bacterium]
MAKLIDRQRLQPPAKTAALVLAAALSACGGGGGGAGTVPNSTGIPPSVQSAQQCSATNPYAPEALKTGSLGLEKQWLRSYFDEAYLWYDEVPVVDANAAAYNNPADVRGSLDNYFEALKTPVVTASGARKDRFGFTYPTAAWNALAQSGVTLGYGFEPVFGSLAVNAQNPNRNIRIAYVEPGTEAAAKALRRGDQVVSVDGVSADTDTPAGVDVLNAAFFPDAAGVAHQWVFSRAGSANFSVTLTTANITKVPVLARSVVTALDGRRVGYLVFNDHLATAEAQLIEAVNHFAAQDIDDLVLDVRYNGGGYLYIASQLAYMIAGPARIQGRLFERLSYNDKRGAGTTTPFYNASTGSTALPTLGLPRVYVLTQSGTCSASESIINGLRGVDVDVRLIGGTTCGKPYGFTAKDNCGISYFPIEFKGTNAKGFGDYPDGFVPAGSGETGIAGCAVADDLDHALGDTSETMLATALAYRSTGACPVLSVGPERAQSAARAGTASSGFMLRGPARENRLLSTGR